MIWQPLLVRSRIFRFPETGRVNSILNFLTVTVDTSSRWQRGLTQMFVSGTSTQKVGEVAQTLMGVAPSASAVSRLNHTLTEQFAVWRECPLPHPLPRWHPLHGASWYQNGFDDHFNGLRCGPGRKQGRAGIASLRGGRQRWVELPPTRSA